MPNTVTGQPPFGPGDVVSFTCKDGFKLEGSASVTCKGDTVWSSDLPTCEYTDAAGAATADRKRHLTSSSGGRSLCSSVVMTLFVMVHFIFHPA